jgi:hypothetical protein
MIRYEGTINRFFTRDSVADVVSGLPKIQTPMMDLLFPQSARKQKASPYLSLDEVTGAIGSVPLTARGGSSVSIDGTGKKRTIIEPCELKPATFLSARDINDLIALNDTESISAALTDRIAELRDTVVMSSETMTRQAFSGKISFPVKDDNGGTANFEIELGTPKNFGTDNIKTANLAMLQTWLEKLYTKQSALSAGQIRFMMGSAVYAKVCDIVISAGSAAPVVWTPEGLILFGKYQILTGVSTYTLPGTDSAVEILGANKVRTFDLSNTGKLFYCALDDLDAKLAPMPFYAKPIYKTDPDGVKLVGSSKIIPAVAVSKMGEQTVTVS